MKALMTRSAWPIRFPKDGVEVLLAETRPFELVNAARLAGNDDSEGVGGLKMTRRALQLGIREVNGRKVTYGDLEEWEKVFVRTRVTMALHNHWTKLHMPTREEREAAIASMSVEVSGTGELWHVTLPGGRTATLAEVPTATVEAAIRAAESGARSRAAQGILGAIENVRRSLRALDGSPVVESELTEQAWDQRISVKETFLLSAAWEEIHGSAEVDVGEALPVSGITSRT